MAHTPFPVEVLTPEGEVFSGEVEMISTFTTLGSIGILARHAPLLATLEPAELRLYRSEDEILRYAQAEGYLQFADNRALLLVEEAIPPQELDQDLLQARLAESRQALDQAAEGSEERARALANVKRYEAFLKISA